MTTDCLSAACLTWTSTRGSTHTLKSCRNTAFGAALCGRYSQRSLPGGARTISNKTKARMSADIMSSHVLVALGGQIDCFPAAVSWLDQAHNTAPQAAACRLL